MKIEYIKNSYIEITDNSGSKYCLNIKKFLDIIEDQRNNSKNNSKNNSCYPYIYGTDTLENLYIKYPELRI